MDRLTDWKQRIAALDAAVRPIANRPVDITDRDWVANLCDFPTPLEEASAGVEIRPILQEIAEISSGVNKCRMGSTRSLLINAVERVK